MADISMESLIKDINDVCHKSLANLPVSKDLPRLGRNFTMYEYTGSNFEVKTFTNDKAKDPIPVVVFRLIEHLSKALNHTHTTPYTEDNFNAEVNMNMHETLTKYLGNHFGEPNRVVNILKTCNQSPVIATLFHVRTALEKIDVRFKDCRGQWFLHFHTGKDKNSPQITQRRVEQVYKMAPDNTRLLNLYKFEWELELIFDSLECNFIKCVALRILRVDFAEEGMELSESERKEAEDKIRSAFEKAHAENLEIRFV
jgi:hypothetical protein